MMLLFSLMEFQSTRPMRGATPGAYYVRWSLRYFNPHAPCGARPLFLRLKLRRLHFNPHAPCGARPYAVGVVSSSWLFQSTRPMRGATNSFAQRVPVIEISIHTPHAGRDPRWIPVEERLPEFQSTRPMRGATMDHHLCYWGDQFQSTRPMRGATWSPPSWIRCTSNFNPHAPCGARPSHPSKRPRQRNFNPHAPCGARLSLNRAGGVWELISIHTPHAGRDFEHDAPLLSLFNFNPHAPCGARRRGNSPAAVFLDFNPHAPCGARPRQRGRPCQDPAFQSTRPMRGATE